MLVYAPGAETVVGINSGYLIQGPVTIHRGGDASDWSDTSAAVKALAALAGLLCLAGLGLFGYVVFADQPDIGEPGFGKMPEGLPLLAGGIFFAGFALAAIASVAHSLRRRPPVPRSVSSLAVPATPDRFPWSPPEIDADNARCAC